MKETRTVHEAMKMDVRTYQYPFTPQQYKHFTGMDAQLAIARAHDYGVGFVIWDRGTVEHAAVIYRLGVVPELVIRSSDGLDRNYATYRRFESTTTRSIPVRRKGLGRRLVEFVENDVRMANKSDALQMTVSSALCRGEVDPDDVSVFLQKVGFRCSGTAKDMFFEYGRPEDGYIFKKELQ